MIFLINFFFQRLERQHGESSTVARPCFESQSSNFQFAIFNSSFLGGSLLARIDRGVTMDPVTSPLIHKDSGHQARVDPGEETPSQSQ